MPPIANAAHYISLLQKYRLGKQSCKEFTEFSKDGISSHLSITLIHAPPVYAEVAQFACLHFISTAKINV